MEIQCPLNVKNIYLVTISNEWNYFSWHLFTQNHTHKQAVSFTSTQTQPPSDATTTWCHHHRTPPPQKPTHHRNPPSTIPPPPPELPRTTTTKRVFHELFLWVFFNRSYIKHVLKIIFYRYIDFIYRCYLAGKIRRRGRRCHRILLMPPPEFVAIAGAEYHQTTTMHDFKVFWGTFWNF